MKRIFTGIITVVMLAVFLAGCQSKPASKTLEISDLKVKSKYDNVAYDGHDRIETGDYSFLTIYATDGIRESESLLYTLTVYDQNDVRHGFYEDIEILPEDSKKRNVSCKVVPQGYVVLEIKRSSGDDEIPVDLSIVLD